MKQILLLSATLLILASTTAAQSKYWNPVTSGTNKRLASVSFGDPNVGYISGADSTLLRTLNGGISWTPVAHSGLGLSLGNPDIIHVNFLSAGTGFAIIGDLDNPVYRGTLYKTIDSGRNWTMINAGNIAMARTYFFDANNGYGVGSAFFAGHTIVKQSAGTWIPEFTLSYDPSKFLYGIDFRNTSMGIVGGYDGLVYRTFNGGVSWDTVHTIVDSTINSLKFLNNRTIIGATDNDGGSIIISTDTGRTWSIESSTLTFAYPDIKALTVSKHDSFIAVGHASFGTNGIVLWHDNAFVNNQMEPQRLNAVTMRDDSIAYIVGDSGTILTNRQPLLSVPTSTITTARTILYPNPAAGLCYTQASYLHSICLYDVIGRLILGPLQPAFTHTINLSNLRRGVYIVQSTPVLGHPVYERLLVE